MIIWLDFDARELPDFRISKNRPKVSKKHIKGLLWGAWTKRMDGYGGQKIGGEHFTDPGNVDR